MLTLFEQQALREVADDFASQVVDAIKNKPIRRRSRKPGVGIFEAPVNATGRLANSVQPQFTDEGIQVLALAYIDNLIFGQAPGQAPNVMEIEKWLMAKGLNYSPAGIVKQIYKYGNSIFAEHQGEDSGLLADVNISGSIEKLKEKLSRQYAEDIAVNFLNQMAA